MAGPGTPRCGNVCAQGPIRPLLGDFNVSTSLGTAFV